jgi:hypothetical protein
VIGPTAAEAVKFGTMEPEYDCFSILILAENEEHTRSFYFPGHCEARSPRNGQAESKQIKTNQNVSFNPSCITRLLPEPMSGFPAATSGVEHPQPKEPGLLRSLPKKLVFDEPNGLAILG